VYVFRHGVGAAWTQQVWFTASDGGANDGFGASLSLTADGNTVLIGAPGKTISNAAVGAAYVYAGSATSWTLTSRLTASDASAGDAFGSSVCLSATGAAALIGAPGKTLNGLFSQGAAYYFAAQPAGWHQSSRIAVSDAAVNAAFGSSLAMAGPHAVFGAPGANGTAGTAYEIELFTTGTAPTAPDTHTTAIAAGVSVSIIVLAGIAGGVCWLQRRPGTAAPATPIDTPTVYVVEPPAPVNIELSSRSARVTQQLQSYRQTRDSANFSDPLPLQVSNPFFKG
jgi:hypothetical protein